jgi:hypothetical protein
MGGEVARMGETNMRSILSRKFRKEKSPWTPLRSRQDGI